MNEPRRIARLTGVLWLVVIAASVVSVVTNFLAPAMGAHVAPFIIPVAILGEGALTLWLIVKGVNVARWKQQGSSAAA
jgi:hypothetical protein